MTTNIKRIMVKAGINADIIDDLIKHGMDDIELEDFIEQPD